MVLVSCSIALFEPPVSSKEIVYFLNTILNNHEIGNGSTGIWVNSTYSSYLTHFLKSKYNSNDFKRVINLLRICKNASINFLLITLFKLWFTCYCYHSLLVWSDALIIRRVNFSLFLAPIVWRGRTWHVVLCIRRSKPICFASSPVWRELCFKVTFCDKRQFNASSPTYDWWSKKYTH